MSVLNQSGEEQVECPLCMEPLEVDDLNFYPCTCGYQICRFCWHRIRTDENGLCPACRKAYSENPADFTPLSKEQVAQLKAEKRARDQQRKARLSESRKHLATVRVVQKNLVFVVGLPVRLADADVLRRHEYFGKFGKIHKVVINQSTSYAGSQGPSASAYVTYYKSEDALRAIQSVNNITLDGRLIKSSLGTTKYCSHFMKNQPCPKPDCMYLHDLGDAEASFTKEEMHQGKHQEYEKRLHEALAAQIQNKSTNNTNQSGQNASTQKEAWPSLSRNGSPPNVGKERKNSNSESKPSSQTTTMSNNLLLNNKDGNSINSNNNNNNNVNQLNCKNTLEHNSSNNHQNITSSSNTIGGGGGVGVHSNATNNTNKLDSGTNNKSQKSKNANKILLNNKHNNQQNNSENITTNNLKNSQKLSENTVISNSKEDGNKLINSTVKNENTISESNKIFNSTNSNNNAPESKLVGIQQQQNSQQINCSDNNNKVSKDDLISTSDETGDRSNNSSPLPQHLSKINSTQQHLYEDNTSFFSPNTFQKLMTDNETAGNNFLESSNSITSNLLNDSLPDINSSEDWEAAFGFTKLKTASTNVNSTNSDLHSEPPTQLINVDYTANLNCANSDDSHITTNNSVIDNLQSSSSAVIPLSTSNNQSSTLVNGIDSVINQFTNAVSISHPHDNNSQQMNNRNSFYNSNTNGLDCVDLIPPPSFTPTVPTPSSDLRNSTLYNGLSLPSVINNTDIKNSISNNSVLNGLDQHMYKFFADFHKNSLKEQQPSISQQPDFINNSFSTSEHIFNPNLIDVGRQNYLNNQLTDHLLSSNASNANSQANSQQMLAAQQQHQQQSLLQQRILEKHLSDQQQILMNLKNQNGHQSPHTLLTVSNQSNFLNHGGYQQNFLLQNQINLVQNQHNLIGGDQHNISLIGNQQNIAQQIIGNSLANQHSNLLTNNTNVGSNQLLGSRLSHQTTNSSASVANSSAAVAAAAAGIQNLIGQSTQQLISQSTQQLIGQNPSVTAATNYTQQYSGQSTQQAQQQASASQHLLIQQNNSVNVTNSSNGPNIHTRNVEDELGFDPFYETQKALAELMESEQMINQQQHRARLPPPGFSHMNSFGIGLPRPHGSKILPFMSLGQTNNNSTHQNVINSPSSNNWSVTNSSVNLGQNSGLGVCNDWTTLDPAIVSSSRHFPFVANMSTTIRDQFSSNVTPLSGNNNVISSSLRGLDFPSSLQQSSNNSGYQTQLNPTVTSVSGIASNGYNSNSQQMPPPQSMFHTSNGPSTTFNGHTGYNTNNSTVSTTIGPNWTDFQNQIPLPPGFRQNNQQSKTQEC